VVYTGRERDRKEISRLKMEREQLTKEIEGLDRAEKKAKKDREAWKKKRIHQDGFVDFNPTNTKYVS
jgi:hypothetical protein